MNTVGMVFSVCAAYVCGTCMSRHMCVVYIYINRLGLHACHVIDGVLPT